MQCVLLWHTLLCSVCYHGTPYGSVWVIMAHPTVQCVILWHTLLCSVGYYGTPYCSVSVIMAHPTVQCVLLWNTLLSSVCYYGTPYCVSVQQIVLYSQIIRKYFANRFVTNLLADI